MDKIIRMFVNQCYSFSNNRHLIRDASYQFNFGNNTASDNIGFFFPEIQQILRRSKFSHGVFRVCPL